MMFKTMFGLHSNVRRTEKQNANQDVINLFCFFFFLKKKKKKKKKKLFFLFCICFGSE